MNTARSGKMRCHAMTNCRLCGRVVCVGCASSRRGGVPEVQGWGMVEGLWTRKPKTFKNDEKNTYPLEKHKSTGSLLLRPIGFPFASNHLRFGPGALPELCLESCRICDRCCWRGELVEDLAAIFREELVQEALGEFGGLGGLDDGRVFGVFV